jgi:hypothetical protein
MFGDAVGHQGLSQVGSDDSGIPSRANEAETVRFGFKINPSTRQAATRHLPKVILPRVAQILPSILRLALLGPAT